MSSTVTMGWDILDRMERAVAKVRYRLLRAPAALIAAGVPYAVVGGHAVASWVATVDEGAVRNEPDVELIVPANERERVVTLLQEHGFIVAAPDGYRTARPRDAIIVHTVPAEGEVPAVQDPAGFPVLALDLLVRLKLASDRNVDRMHIHDLVGVDLIDRSWVRRLPPELGERLQHILDTPQG